MLLIYACSFCCFYDLTTSLPAAAQHLLRAESETKRVVFRLLISLFLSLSLSLSFAVHVYCVWIILSMFCILHATFALAFNCYSFQRKGEIEGKGREGERRRGSQRVVANESAHSTHSQLSLVELIVSEGGSGGRGRCSQQSVLLFIDFQPNNNNN